jgi:hypothetical protein
MQDQGVDYLAIIALLQKELQTQKQFTEGKVATAHNYHAIANKLETELTATKRALETAVQHNAALLPKAEAFDALKEAWDKYTLRWVFDKGRRGAGIFRKILGK